MMKNSVSNEIVLKTYLDSETFQNAQFDV